MSSILNVEDVVASEVGRAAFIEAELAKRLGKRVDEKDNENPEAKRKRLEAELYQIPDEFKSNLVGDTVVPGMTAIITEVPLAAAVRIANIEAVESMKKRMLTGGRDDDGANKGPQVKRNQFVDSFGKQKRVELSREELEEQHRRMKFVSERKPAVAITKLKQQGQGQ